MIQNIVAGVFIFILAAVGAHAQLPMVFPVEPPEPLLHEALDHPFGRMVVVEFKNAVMKSADAACLQSKGLDDSKLIDRGRDLFLRYGTKSMGIIINSFDAARYEVKIKERAGPNSVGELILLREDPAVKEYLRLERPARLARVLNFVVENFERYALITGIKLPSFSGISTGNDTLLHADPTEQSEDDVQRFVTSNSSAELRRFMALSEIMAPAIMEVINPDLSLRWGPNTFFRGVENDLANICIVGR